MNDHQRFEDLLNDFLEGELSPEGVSVLQQMLQDPHRLSHATDQYQLHRLLGLRGQGLNEHEDDFVAATMDLLPADSEQFVTEVEATVSKLQARNVIGRKQGNDSVNGLRIGLSTIVLSAALALLLSCWLYYGWRSTTPEIELVEFRGEILLTGDGGKVVQDLAIGHRFLGGTVESVSPDSYCKLRFDDKTTVTISGRTLVTLSQNGQKIVRLRRGNLSADVTPQPIDHPMLVFTEAAELKVLGTEFNVEAMSGATSLVVNEGLVRLKRLTDGKQIEVPARQSVIASLEDQSRLSPIRRETPVTAWQSDLERDSVIGKWISRHWMLGAKLKKAVANGEMTKSAAVRAYKTAASFDDATGSVWAMPSPVGSLIVLSPRRSLEQPVLINANTWIKVCGRTYSQFPMKIGLSVGRPDGGFEGKYSTQILGSEMAAGEEFEIEFPIDRFRDAKNPSRAPTGKELIDWWCITESSSAKYEITRVEITDRKEKNKP